MALFHAYTQTVADGTATSVVRPSDWNSGHAQAVTLSGNTVGASSITGTNIIYQGGNNVTLSGVQGANAATIVVSGPVSGGASAGKGVDLFFSAAAAGVGGYEVIAEAPDTDVEQDETIVVTNQTLPFEAYATTALGRSVIDAGIWQFSIYAYADPSGGLTTLTFKVYSRTSGGTETLLFSVTSEDIDANTATLYEINSVQPEFAINTTDLLVVKVDASTTSVDPVTVHFVHSGTAHYSHIHTTFSTLHNDVAGLQGGSTDQYYHLNAADYANRNTTGTGYYAVSNATTNAVATSNSTLFAGTGFSGTNISGTVNSNGLQLSVAAGGGGADGYNILAAGTQTATTAGTVQFANSNGISFGMSGSTQITASHNGLTTAAQSNHSHGNPTLALTNLNGTTASASNGLTLSLSAIVPAQTVQPVAYSAANGSAAFSTLSFANSNGVSFSSGTQGVFATVATNYAVSNITTNNIATANSSLFQHTSATSAITSNAFPSANTTQFAGTGTTFAGTNVSASMTFNSNGLNLALSAPAGGGGGGGVGTQFSGTNISGTLDTNGISLSVAPGGGGADGYNIIGVNGGATNSATTYIFSNANNVSFGLNAGTITASASYAAQTVDTNKAGIGFTSTTAAGTAVAATLNTNGLSMAIPGYLTTAAATNVTTNNMATAERGNYFYTSNNTFANATHSHGNPTLALTNLSGTTASASNGFTLSLSAAAPGGGGTTNQTGPNIAVAGSTVTSGDVYFSNSPTVTFGLSGSTITASAAGGGGGAAADLRYVTSPWAAMPFGLLTNVTAISERPIFIPFDVNGNFTGNELMYKMSRATSGSNLFSLDVGIYSYANSTSINLIGSNRNTYSNTATASVSAIRLFEASLGTNFSSLTPGQYVLGLKFSAAATASMNYSLMGASTNNPAVGGIHPGADTYATHTSHQPIPMHGRFTNTTNALPGAVAGSQIQGWISGASLALPVAFTLGVDN